MSWWNRLFGGAQTSASSNAFTLSPRNETRWLGASRVARSLSTWFARIGSGTSDNPSGELSTLRARSRDAFRNHLIARAALTRSRTNIVGTGLMCRPAVDHAVLGLTEEEAEVYNIQLQSSFEAWAEDPAECDAEATLSFYGQQGLVQLSAMASGDCLALTPFEMRPGGWHGLKVQVVEGDRCENPPGEPNRPSLIDGVALGTLGNPLGYWIRSNHPGDVIVSPTIPTWDFYPAFGELTGRRRVMHVWNDKERPGQVRGAPYLAPILEPLRQVSRWTDNELMAAVVSALFTVFIENTEQPPVDDDGKTVPAFGGAPAPQQPTNGIPPPEAQAQAVTMGNGAIVELPPKTKASFANPARPSAQFDPFFVAMVKQIGAALEIPGDELLLTYAGSYTAARAAMLQAWRFYIMRRESLASQFCQPVYNLLMDEEVATGRLKLPGYADPRLRCAWQNCMWIGPARGAMDELKEAQAAKTRIEIGVSNEARECQQMSGESRRAIYAEQLREINQRKRDGTWEMRPSGTVRVSPVEDPNATPKPASDEAAQQLEDEAA